MMYGMKGEWPDDVKKPEEVKAEKEKKPFYKQGKWWLLAAIATLMAVATGYGMWLGSQYVKAVENAAHIIAEAQEPVSEGLRKDKSLAQNDGNRVLSVDLGSLSWSYNSNRLTFSAVVPNAEGATGGRYAPAVSDVFNLRTGNVAYSGSEDLIFGIFDNSIGYFTDFSLSDATAFKNKYSGHLLYYRGATGVSAYDSAYQEGYDIGSQDGYDEGYQDGYQDGVDATDVEQTIHVGCRSSQMVGYYFGVKWTENGSVVADLTKNAQDSWADCVFSRSVGDTGLLQLSSTNNERVWIFYSYVGMFSEPYASLTTQVMSDVLGQYYFPTDKTDIYIWFDSFTTTNIVQEGYDLVFDPDAIEDVKIGGYSKGYTAGYDDGRVYGYEEGFEDGKQSATDEAYTAGFNAGAAEGATLSKSLSQMFVTAFQQPFNALYRYLNFNFLGINFLAVFAGLITLGLGIYVIKKVL